MLSTLKAKRSHKIEWWLPARIRLGGLKNNRNVESHLHYHREGASVFQ
jgi:hypothetical protein